MTVSEIGRGESVEIALSDLVELLAALRAFDSSDAGNGFSSSDPGSFAHAVRCGEVDLSCASLRDAVLSGAPHLKAMLLKSFSEGEAMGIPGDLVPDRAGILFYIYVIFGPPGKNDVALIDTLDQE